jgi:hypothetical protein
MNDEIDRRLRQLAQEQADAAPPPHDWDEGRGRTAESSPLTAPTAPVGPERRWRLAAVAAAVVAVVVVGAATLIRLGDQPPTVTTGGPDLTVATSQPGLDSVPGSTAPESTSPGTAPPSTQPGPDLLVSIPHRVLVDGNSVGDVWVTSVANTREEFGSLLDELGITFEPLEPPLDFTRQVVIHFGPAESGSCRFGPLADVVFDPATRRLFPVLTLEDPLAEGETRACTADANPHPILVAIDRADLPTEAFDIWVENAPPPACCGNGVTRVSAQQLIAPPGVEERPIDVPTGTIEAGPDDLFVVHADGDLYLHPGMLSDAPGEPFRLAQFGDPREPVLEGPGPNAVDRVAGVHRGAVLFGDCCEPAAGNLLAATGPDSERNVWAFGFTPALSPGGSRLAAANWAEIQVVDLDRAVVRSRPITVQPWDVIWSADGNRVYLLHNEYLVDDDQMSPYAVWVFDEMLFPLGSPQPTGIAFEPGVRVEFAGRAAAGDLAVSVVGDDIAELRFLDPDTLQERTDLRRALPAGATGIRVSPDGRSLLWVEGDVVWFEGADSTPRQLGTGYRAAWFVP